VMAILFLEHAEQPRLDLLRVLKMVLIHDLVEIDAGDTFVYDDVGTVDKAEQENAAADRVFGLLPADQATEFRASGTNLRLARRRKRSMPPPWTVSSPCCTITGPRGKLGRNTG
jgi:hypothetical protein